MAQASSSSTAKDSSRDRAVSSEPCSTRPNPFDDSGVPSKRRRTSLNNPSRSRSVDAVALDDASSAGAADGLASVAGSDSAMKIDTETTTPQTPERQILEPADADPSSVLRSSRVTINVRTPSRPPLDAIPSSPPGSPTLPSSKGPPRPSSPTDAVKISIEESEVDMSRGEAAINTPVSSATSSSSPPLEVIHVIPDDDDEFEDAEPITILDDSPDDSILVDPTALYPFHVDAESWMDTTTRTSEYMQSHPSVAKEYSQWVAKYLEWTNVTPTVAIVRSYIDHREIWHSFPELVLNLANRRQPYTQNKVIRHDIFLFFKWFARLTGTFVKVDLQIFPRLATNYQAGRPLDLLSPLYVQATSLLCRREEMNFQMNHSQTVGDDFNYALEVAKVFEVFQTFDGDSGTVFEAMQLALAEAEYIAQIPGITDHISGLSSIAAQVLQHMRRNQHLPPDVVRGTIARAYQYYTSMSATLASAVDKNLNRLSVEGTAALIQSLTDIYQLALNTNGTVPGNPIEDHLQRYPQVPHKHVPEAIAYIEKFSLYSRLIQSSQMQLRVMAVSSMCNDLVAFYRRYGSSPEDEDKAMMRHYADFLTRTGLVNYIIGPTCHPEITLESYNIIGFLAVSCTYEKEHTDALWQTVTTTQDPRVSDALVKMLKPIINLFQSEWVLYLCSKLLTVPVDSFNMAMRECFDSVIKALINKPVHPGIAIADSTPYNICIRLIRESSAFGAQSAVAWPEMQQFALQKFKELLMHGPGPEGRQKIAADCLDDLSRPSQSTIGSLWVLLHVLRPQVQREFSGLAYQYELAKILIDELEGAVPRGRAAGFPAVLSGPNNTPRRELLSVLIISQPASLTGDLGLRLWELLVGPRAACKEDRDIAWQLLNSAMKQGNGFTHTCFFKYLPLLDPEYFCQGSLEFVREILMPGLISSQSTILDDIDGPNPGGMLEILWRMVLRAPKGTIEQQAIDTLVRDVYVDSGLIASFPHYRARKVHLGLVDRCLRQLSSAAAKLRSFADGTASSDEDSMVVVATDQEVNEQQLLFIRSLIVLREFHRLHQDRPEFSTPDLRTFIGDVPKQPEGESAELKFQSFDGTTETAVQPLNIGRLNTAASLLASLREATGFTNYRIFYRGKPFVPQEGEICKSLEDLQIHNGIILVKKEEESATSPRARPGASQVEVEILSHFDDLWQYLSLEESLAREIFLFLVKLPTDENTIKAFQNASTSYQDMFPAGQPFKSLYAVHALRSYLSSQKPQQAKETSWMETSDASDSSSSYGELLMRAMSLIVPAISDENVTSQCSSRELQIELSSALLKALVALLQDSHLPSAAANYLNEPLLCRLLSLMSTALSMETSGNPAEQALLCLESILESCSVNEAFMSAFSTHSDVPRLVERLLLHEPKDRIRQSAGLLIRHKCKVRMDADDGVSGPDPISHTFRKLFWPIVSSLVRPAVQKVVNAAEVLSLSLMMLHALIRSDDDILDCKTLSQEWFTLLLEYTTFEDVTKPQVVDSVANYLASHLHALTNFLADKGDQAFQRGLLPKNGVAARIFWKHLFPATDDIATQYSDSGTPILTTSTRAKLIEIILRLVQDDMSQLRLLINHMFDLVNVKTGLDQDSEPTYQYDLQPAQPFEREKAIRAECGYTGLRNLSNTCYFNSLYTQLFMNVDFRRFMLSATVKDPDTQCLLFNTQKTFAYLQDSIRRSTTPEECVASIRTYENTQIDVSVQMDVDEFFNLLFDRWEGQFLSDEEKNLFRSFYGGQLVQQVRSKECDHISERLEPFSAIQCDIKGKATLQESLQAYVEGEIMEGDNKYKCSTCDHHVDAVKRTCIKTAPDHLIFHLKRFDFNLRTMQRSKINDWFSFPTTIDMRPYTMEYLSDPDQDQPEDMFELVGILVHSGTAESGHYYSFVRERPTSNDKQTWIEFNDDNVNPWDPSQMEGACFGGPDYQPFQNNVPYDKQYSAYMLFYQRSSSLTKSQALLQQSNLTVPLRVDIPVDMEEYIQGDNTLVLRRHCLYDPVQSHFVANILERLKRLNGDECSSDHRLGTKAMFMALGHLDQVTSRAKDTPNFALLVSRLRSDCQDCARCSLGLLRYFAQMPQTFRMLVQRNADPDVRKAAANLVIRALTVIRKTVPDQYGLYDEDEIFIASRRSSNDNNGTCLSEALLLIDTLLANFAGHLRSWYEVFGFILSFVNLGDAEISAFLASKHFETLLWIIIADPNLEKIGMPNQINRLLGTLSRRQPTRAPNYETIIAVLDVVIAKVELLDRFHRSMYEQYQYPARTPVSEPPFVLHGEEAEAITLRWTKSNSNIFVDKLISLGQNPEATDSIVANLIQQGDELEMQIYKAIRASITGSVVSHTVGNYLRVAGGVFCRVASQRELIRELIRHVNMQCMQLQNSEAREFFEFQKKVFDGPRTRSGETPQQILLAGYDNIPNWVPGLLVFYETSVGEEVVRFLYEKLFQSSTATEDSETDESRMLVAKMTQTARKLGFQCLGYLREKHVKRGVDISERVMALFERVIKICARYFHADDSEDLEAVDFETLRKSEFDDVLWGQMGD
ncbi:ubiquitin carboxyl-terminal hydrolase 34 [Podospora fimiseda]|uniref:Ubiquitin carboxyl-terminal hydrolase 34 n=1 Tax=Podospora fimiseda TaxID=252190 RepID=A0AAN7GZF7_9PEZI|nr:ubiquitin carboxyl-terminal hydrolase 34 [Podospora fimiseda]